MMNPLISGLCVVAAVIGLGAFLSVAMQAPPPGGHDWHTRFALTLLVAAMMGVPIRILVHYGAW